MVANRNQRRVLFANYTFLHGISDGDFNNDLGAEFQVLRLVNRDAPQQRILQFALKYIFWRILRACVRGGHFLILGGRPYRGFRRDVNCRPQNERNCRIV
jgi:hypothetical protein